MKQHVRKVYEEDGIQYQFDSKKLLSLMNQRKHSMGFWNGERTTKAQIIDELAERLFVSTDAVKNWMYGYNGPSEIEQVKVLGEYFSVDYHQLLMKEADNMAQETVSKIGVNSEAQAQYTKECIRNIYRAIIDCIDRTRYYYLNLMTEEEKTKGFLSPAMISDAYADMRAKYNHILEVLEYSMLDISEEIYTDIEEFLWEELDDAIDSIAGPEVELRVEQRKPEEDEALYDDYTLSYTDMFLNQGYMPALKRLFRNYRV